MDKDTKTIFKKHFKKASHVQLLLMSQYIILNKLFLDLEMIPEIKESFDDIAHIMIMELNDRVFPR